jgi:Carboxypeptidase regulatory-like domain
MRKRLALSGTVLVLCGIALVATGQAEQRNSDRMRTLTGHVFGSQDEPVQKAIVYLKNTKTLAIKTYISDPDGSYRFSALSPNVDYEVYAELNGAHSDTKTLSAFDNRKQANITLRIHTQK